MSLWLLPSRRATSRQHQIRPLSDLSPPGRLTPRPDVALHSHLLLNLKFTHLRNNLPRHRHLCHQRRLLRLKTLRIYATLQSHLSDIMSAPRANRDLYAGWSPEELDREEKILSERLRSTNQAIVLDEIRRGRRQNRNIDMIDLTSTSDQPPNSSTTSGIAIGRQTTSRTAKRTYSAEGLDEIVQQRRRAPPSSSASEMVSQESGRSAASPSAAARDMVTGSANQRRAQPVSAGNSAVRLAGFKKEQSLPTSNRLAQGRQLRQETQPKHAEGTNARHISGSVLDNAANVDSSLSSGPVPLHRVSQSAAEAAGWKYQPPADRRTPTFESWCKDRSQWPSGWARTLSDKESRDFMNRALKFVQLNGGDINVVSDHISACLEAMHDSERWSRRMKHGMARPYGGYTRDWVLWALEEDGRPLWEWDFWAH